MYGRYRKSSRPAKKMSATRRAYLAGVRAGKKSARYGKKKKRWY